MKRFEKNLIGVKVFSFLFLLLILNITCKKEKPIGKLSWQEWKNRCNWKSIEAASYSPDSLTVTRISKLSDSLDVNFLIVGGSWCKDTRSEFPKIFKLLELASIPQKKIALYGVDRSKHDGKDSVAFRHDVWYVPTLIIKNKTREMGRIVEYPRHSWEKDIINILSHKASQLPSH